MSDLPPLAAGSSPGWYDDPADATKRRYWDGATWTDRTTTDPAASPAPDATPASGPAQGVASPAGGSQILGKIALALFALVLVAMVWSSLNSNGGAPPAGSTGGATSVCRQFVKEELRSPATAQFSAEIAVDNGGSFTVTGSVDSENGFGALIRSTFACTVRHRSGDEYVLVDLNIV